MSLRPFWRYYGGKWRAAPRYPRPLHDTIVEPFAGAAGYSLRYPHKRVILVEKYSVIAELWRYLIAAKESEILAIPCVDAVDDLPTWVPAGARSLVGFAMNDGVTSPCRMLSAGRRKMQALGRRLDGWTEAKRYYAARGVSGIRHWTVIEGEYTAAPDIEATWFVDPPYEGAGVHYKHPSTAIDFPALGSWCRSRLGQTIVCENVGASWLPFRPFGRETRNPMSNAASREAIWTSDPPRQVDMFDRGAL